MTLQLSQEAYALRRVLRDIKEVKRDLPAIGPFPRNLGSARWETHFATLQQLERDLRAGWPNETRQIEAWEDEQELDVGF